MCVEGWGQGLTGLVGGGSVLESDVCNSDDYRMCWTACFLIKRCALPPCRTESKNNISTLCPACQDGRQLSHRGNFSVGSACTKLRNPPVCPRLSGRLAPNSFLTSCTKKVERWNSGDKIQQPLLGTQTQRPGFGHRGGGGRRKRAL